MAGVADPCRGEEVRAGVWVCEWVGVEGDDPSDPSDRSPREHQGERP